MEMQLPEKIIQGELRRFERGPVVGEVMGGGRGQGGVSSRNHEDHFSISRVTKNKISFSRFLETQKRNKVWNHLTHTDFNIRAV
jgi:hypothetical protein